MQHSFNLATEIEKAEKLLPDIQTRKGMGMEDYSHFISPWAQSWEEEVFFETSVKTLVQLLRGDLKTSLLFQLLLLTSKPVGSAAANSGLKQVKVGHFCPYQVFKSHPPLDGALQ